MFVICTKTINLFGSLYRVRYRGNLKVVLLFTRCFASSGTIEDIKYILPCFPTVSLSLNQDLCIKKAQTSLRCVLGDILMLKCNLKKALYLLRPLYGSFCVEEMQAIFFRAEVCCILLRCFHSSTLNLNV